MAKLAEASAAEAEAANAVWQAAQSSSGTPEETSVLDNNSQAAETTSDGSDTEADVRLHPRAVCILCIVILKEGYVYVQASKTHNIMIVQVVVAKETVGSLGGMVRQLSLDQFENESRRMVPLHNDLSQPKRPTKPKSPQGLHKKVSNVLVCFVLSFFL